MAATLVQEKRHEEKVRTKRLQAAMKRWHPDDAGDLLEEGDVGGDGGDDVELEEIEQLQVEPRRLVFDGANVDDQTSQVERSSRSKDNRYGMMSRRTYFRKMEEIKESFERHTNGWQENIDVALNLLTRSDHLINKDKMEIKVYEKRPMRKSGGSLWAITEQLEGRRTR